MKRDDDLFLDALEQDEDVAWKLAEATARPLPPALRARIVERHRRRRWSLAWSVPRLAVATAAVVLVLAGLLLTVRTELEVIAALPGARVVEMSGAAGRGVVVIRGETAYLVLDLPAPPEGKAYEAWIIRDGTPLRAGMAPARGGIVAVRLERALRHGDVTAVTLEIAGGVDAPTSPPVLVGPT
jgi:hypothetical protein